MAKCYLAVKRSYADFDIPIEEPVLASNDINYIDGRVAEFNAKRSKEDIKYEVKYKRRTVKFVQV